MIEIENLSKTYGDARVVVDVTMAVPANSITVIVGTSGSGKTTVLRMVNRLVEPTSGTVRIDGQDTGAVPGPELRRQIGYVIQGHGLFPHRTVAQNVATVPNLLGWERARIDARVAELLTLFQLDPALYGPRYPHELSGGQQQRVGVARALAAEPRVLLMDEPFGALDPLIRAKAQDDLLAIQRRFGTTVILVTHDMEEAIHLGDRIAVMDAGRLDPVRDPGGDSRPPGLGLRRDAGRAGRAAVPAALARNRRRGDRARPGRGRADPGDSQPARCPRRDAVGRARGAAGGRCRGRPGRSRLRRRAGAPRCTARRVRIGLVLRLLALALLVAFLASPQTFAPVFRPLTQNNAPAIYTQNDLLTLTLVHLRIVFLATFAATVVALALAVLVTRPFGAEFLPLSRGIVNIGQTFPPVAVLAIAVPLVGFGAKPTLFALFLYGLLPIFENGITGLTTLSDPVMEAARGAGMTPSQQLARVELPLAFPVILAGVRLSVVISLATATIGSTVGASTLGEVIIAGLLSNNLAFVVQGGLIVGTLAVLINDTLVALERMVARRMGE